MKDLTALLPRKKGMTPGKVIKHYRESYGLAQTHLCEIIGINQSNLSAIENDKRTLTLSFAIRFSAIFNIDPLDLLYPNGIKNTKEWKETRKKMRAT